MNEFSSSLLIFRAPQSEKKTHRHCAGSLLLYVYSIYNRCVIQMRGRDEKSLTIPPAGPDPGMLITACAMGPDAIYYNMHPEPRA